MNNIVKSIEEAINSEEFYQLTTEDNTNNIISDIINYCVLMEDSQGAISYASYKKFSEREKYFISQLYLKLGLKITDPTAEDKISQYLFERIFTKGYVYHSTNSLALSKIEEEGIVPNGNAIYYDEMKEIDNIYNKYHLVSDLLYLIDDTEHNRGWFYDSCPDHILSYMVSPEWMKYFCGMEAYRTKNYNLALAKITRSIQLMSQDDQDKILEVFDKYWNIYKDAKPRLLLVSRQAVFEYGKDFTYDMAKENGVDLAFLMNCALNPQTLGINSSCKKIIKPENILVVNIESLLNLGKNSNKHI